VHRDTTLTAPRVEEWLLIEWPEAETEPTRTDFARRSPRLFYSPADEHVRCVLGDMMAHVIEPVPAKSDGE
jgi:hypothetical protein